MNTNEKLRLKDFIKSLQFIHIAFVLGIIAFGIITAINAKDPLFFSYKQHYVFIIVAIVIAFLGNITSRFIYRSLINQISSDFSIFQKARKYITAHIYRVAMIEFPALICIIFVMQLNNMFFYIISAILVVVLISIYPTKKKFINDVQLTENEKSMLESFN